MLRVLAEEILFANWGPACRVLVDNVPCLHSLHILGLLPSAWLAARPILVLVVQSGFKGVPAGIGNTIPFLNSLGSCDFLLNRQQAVCWKFHF